MSSHYESNHYAASHYLSSHYGRTGIAPPPVVEEGGGSAGKGRRQSPPHGAYIPTVRLPAEIPREEVYDDAELAALAILLIEEFYE